MHGQRAASLAREAVEAKDLGAPHRDHRRGEGAQDRAHAPRQGLGDAPGGAQAFRVVVAGLWGLSVWFATQGPSLAAAQNMSEGVDVLVHFTTEQTLYEYCKATSCQKQWSGVVFAAQVVVAHNDSNFRTEAQSVYDNAANQNGTVTYNSVVKAQDPPATQGRALRDAASELYPKLTCDATGVHAYILDTGVMAEHVEFEAEFGSRVLHDLNAYPSEPSDDCDGQ